MARDERAARLPGREPGASFLRHGRPDDGREPRVAGPSMAPATDTAEASEASAVPAAVPLTAAEVRAFCARLAATSTPGGAPADQRERVEVLAALEELKAGACAAQSTVALAVDESTRRAEAAHGVAAEERGRGVARQVGLAMRRSPFAARVFLGAARVWHTEMPHTLAALAAGRLSEQRAVLLVRETACMPREARARVDAELCADPRTLEGVGTHRLLATVRARAAALDPAAVVARAERAVASRGVWVRPAPDGMSYVTALLPLAQGVGVFASLRRAADTARACGDPRSRGQVMADTFAERATRAGDAPGDVPGAVPVTIDLVLSDATLLGAGHEPAVVLDDAGRGHGTVPAQVARNLVANALDAGAAWLRTLYTDPAGRLVAATSTRRFFADGLAAMLRVRDQGLCRTPYCDAPVRQLDHVDAHAAGGATDLDNGQGLCEACNLAKEAPGWSAVAGRDPATGRHRVVTTTPAAQAYASTAPPPPVPAVRAAPGRRAEGTRVERVLIDLFRAYAPAA